MGINTIKYLVPHFTYLMAVHQTLFISHQPMRPYSPSLHPEAHDKLVPLLRRMDRFVPAMEQGSAPRPAAASPAPHGGSPQPPGSIGPPALARFPGHWRLAPNTDLCLYSYHD